MVSSSISTSILGKPGEALLQGLFGVGVDVGGGEVGVGTGVLVTAGRVSVGWLVKVRAAVGSGVKVGAAVLISSIGLKLGVGVILAPF
jgi:hypothetical protein